MAKTSTPEDVLADVLAKMTEPEDIKALFEDMFTTREIRDMASRFNVAVLLSEGKTYLEVEKETGASPTTIARVNKCLTSGSGGYKKALACIDN